MLRDSTPSSIAVIRRSRTFSRSCEDCRLDSSLVTCSCKLSISLCNSFSPSVSSNVQLDVLLVFYLVVTVDAFMGDCFLFVGLVPDDEDELRVEFLFFPDMIAVDQIVNNLKKLIDYSISLA